MLYIKSNTSFTYKVQYKVGEDYVTPTSATITIKSPNNSSILATQSLIITPAQTFTNVNILASNNIKTTPNDFRVIEINFQYQGFSYTFQEYYNLASNISIPVVPEEVRNLLGLSASELSDDQINIYAAYQAVNLEYSNLDAVITTGSLELVDAKQAIMLKAAIQATISLELFLNEKEQADNVSFKRFSNFDFDAIIERLNSRYNNLITTLKGGSILGYTPVSSVTRVAVVNAITGV